MTLWLPWRDGPARDHDGPVLVSLTQFTAARAHELPGIYRAGMRLRGGWYALPGALGMWLWAAMPHQRRCGSLSIWQSEEHLQRFVALPAHLAIMRKYRTRGELTSHTWQLDHFDKAAAHSRALTMLRDDTLAPPPTPSTRRSQAGGCAYEDS
jgi:heme-degrading monooxygenase HmoA